MNDAIFIAILLIAFGVLILWGVIWAAVSKKKIWVFLPFILAGLSSLFYSAILIENPQAFSLTNFRIAVLVFNFLIILVLARRKSWKTS